MKWLVYLSGEIHSDWRQQIEQASSKLGLPVSFCAPVTDHPASDAAGDVLGAESVSYWRDHKSAKVNGVRTQSMIQKCDLAVIRFGEKYRQWNAAFDAGQCAALGKPYITLHDENLIHALKEVDAAAAAWAQSPQQVVDVIRYITSS